MKKKIVAGICMLTLGLTGCGSDFPNLSDEEASAIGEYAAITLLKYDANSRSRLVDLSEVDASLEESEEPQKPIVGENKQEEIVEQEPDTPPTQENIIDVNQQENTCNSMEEFLELPELVKVSYVGFELSPSYQEEGNSYFVLEASEDKELLVLKFDIQNDSAEAQEINLLARMDNYRITVNESYTRAALTTMLSNDMSTYVKVLDSGEKAGVVLLMEVDSTIVENLESISLNLKNESKIYTIQLL